jgi:hypothetical protein
MNTRVAFAAVAVGAALLGGAAHAVGTAPSAGADTGTDLDPFADLYGDTGFNSWTPSTDSFLNSIDPTNALAGNLDTSVDGFQTGGGFFPNDPFTLLTHFLDPSAFTYETGVGLFPDNAIGDFATGLDFSGLFGPVNIYLDGLLSELGVPGFL